MGLFGRRRAAEEPENGIFAEGAPADSGMGVPGTDGFADPAAGSSQESGALGGPWDVDQVPERGTRLDLGAIWLPAVNGMQLRMEANKQRGVVTSATVMVDQSSLQIQVFAAPRSAGIWEEIRAEIAASVTGQGGSVDDLPGPFGRELLARLPLTTAEGRTGHRPARFIGVDGPRWFVRGVLSGRGAVDPESARTLENMFSEIVVIRGSEARAPRELLPLTMPQSPSGAPSAQETPPPDPFRRGPEITEVH